MWAQMETRNLGSLGAGLSYIIALLRDKLSSAMQEAKERSWISWFPCWWYGQNPGSKNSGGWSSHFAFGRSGQNPGKNTSRGWISIFPLNHPANTQEIRGKKSVGFPMCLLRGPAKHSVQTKLKA